METTIDAGGRVVIPKSIRDRLGLVAGTVIDIVEREGRVEIAPAEAAIHLVEVDGVVVARSAEALPPLTDDIVRETIEKARR